MEAVPGRQRHGGAPRGGPPVAPEGPRLASVGRALRARHFKGWRLSALRHPLAGVATRGRNKPGAPQAPRERRELRFDKNCGSNESREWVPGTSGPGLFDIVNRTSTAPHRLHLSAGATHRHALSSPLEQHTRLSSPRKRGPSIPPVRVYGTMGPRLRGDDSTAGMGNARPAPVFFSCCLQEKQDTTQGAGPHLRGPRARLAAS
jgi:hypothetical protein